MKHLFNQTISVTLPCFKAIITIGYSTKIMYHFFVRLYSDCSTNLQGDTTMKLNGSQIMLRSLVEENVEVIFGYPGGAIMPIYDALYDMRNEIHHILSRHEQGAVHAAEGYARVAGKVGVCFATSGPGATNLITGMADAMLDSVPLVCITGQVAEKFLGSDAFQESDIVGMSVPATKWNYQITSAAEIPQIIHKAFKVARSGRPGPVLIDITKNAQIELLEYNTSKSDFKFKPKQCPPLDDKLVQMAAELLNNAKRPIVLAGHGITIAQAESELLKLAEKADLPITSTLLGLSAFPSEHKLFKGMLGMHGNYAANILSNQADVVLAVGMRFDDRVTGDLSRYLNDAKVIHIDIDPAELDKNVQTDVALNIDAKLALSALLPLVQKKQHDAWHAEFTKERNKENKTVIEKDIAPQSGKIKMAEFVNLLSQKTEGNALLVTDVGQHQMIAARYYKFNQRKSHITSGGLGTMGFSLPASVGAQIAAKDRLVISISGDGGFQMNIQELAMITQENLPVKIVILNNGYLGMVRQWQEFFFEKRYSFTEIQSPNFVTVANGYGIQGEKVSKREDLSSAIDTMLASESSYLLEVCVEKEDTVFPMVCPGASISETRLQ